MLGTIPTTWTVPSRPRPVRFRAMDLVAIAVPVLFAALFAASSSAPPWPALRLLAAAAGVVLMRLGPARSPRPSLRWLARLYPLVVVGVCYYGMGPVIDVVSPELFDARLAAIDAWLFGEVPAVAMQAIQHPALTELAFLCYAGFFVWQAGLLVVLGLRADRRAFEALLTTLVLFYLLSDVMYLLVPATGPRFFLADQLTVPLEGLWFAAGLEQSFYDNPVIRDCFPSGHTGLTLMVLGHAWRHARRFFWVMLPFAAVLIFSTVYCRFHYVIDLLCALPFVLFVGAVQAGLHRLIPAGLILAAPERARDHGVAA